MKAIVYNITTNPRYIKVFQWGKLITITGSTQLIVQLSSLICGVIIIRVLSSHEYALYTLTNTMLGTLCVLSDGGITSGVMAEGGKVWKNKEKLGMVLCTGLKLRRKFGIWSVIVSTPVLIYFLLHHNASLITTLLIVLSLIPAFFANLSDSLLEIGPKLHQDIAMLQKNGLIVSIMRLVLTVIPIIAFPWAFIAIISGGIPRIWANNKLKKSSIAYVNWNQDSDNNIRKSILFTVKRTLPSSIYFCISGQITIWLISIFGSSQAVAQVGALGRISILLSLSSMIFQIIVVPRFARLPNCKANILKWFVLIQFILFFYSVTAITIVSFFSTDILRVIGNKFSGMENTLVLSITSAVLTSSGGALYSILIARNWIINPLLSITVGITSQIFLIKFVDLSTVRGVYHFSIIETSIAILMTYIYVFIIFKKRSIV